MAIIRLNCLAAGLKGRVGNAVFVQTPGGTVVRNLPQTFDPQTEAQIAQRERLAQTARAWQSLSPDAVERWSDYALSLARRDPATGQIRAPRPMGVFTALYGKRLQIDPGALPPLFPPDAPFLGDGIAVSVEGREGAVAFVASGPNAEGVLTELMLQPLVGPNRRSYGEKYRGRGFWAFESGALEHLVPADRGWHACAVRFVKASTGQTSALAVCGKVLVG